MSMVTTPAELLGEVMTSRLPTGQIIPELTLPMADTDTVFFRIGLRGLVASNTCRPVLVPPT